jgi:hypothetical protein
MRRSLAALVCLGLVIASAGEATAQGSRTVQFGPQLSWGDDADLGVGGRAQVSVPATQFVIIGSFDLFFPDSDGGPDIDYWEINGNAVYEFDLAGETTIRPYAGAGLNIAHATRDLAGLGDSNTDLGLNLLGGARFDAGPIQPFIELRVEAEGGEQFVITGGVLF